MEVYREQERWEETPRDDKTVPNKIDGYTAVCSCPVYPELAEGLALTGEGAPPNKSFRHGLRRRFECSAAAFSAARAGRSPPAQKCTGLEWPRVFLFNELARFLFAWVYRAGV